MPQSVVHTVHDCTARSGDAGHAASAAIIGCESYESLSKKTMAMTAPLSPDPDIHKGAMEDDRPCATTNAPGLDDDGLPNDEIAIAEDALGAREDGSQG
jgi:hypothetical protein